MNKIILMLLLSTQAYATTCTKAKHQCTQDPQIVVENAAGFVTLDVYSEQQMEKSMALCQKLAKKYSCVEAQLEQDELVRFGERGSGGVYYTDLGRDRVIIAKYGKYNLEDDVYFTQKACLNGILNKIKDQL